MLPTDLVRVSVKRGVIKPRFIREDSPALRRVSVSLIEAFQAHIGETYGTLDEALKEIEGDSTQFQVIRGLAGLLHKRTKLITHSPRPPMELRRMVFERSAQHHPIAREKNLYNRATRQQILEEVAKELECDVELLEGSLYADLREAQIVNSFDPLDPNELLSRYNVALAQGVLLRASNMTITIHQPGRESSARYRQFFRYLKFFQLMHTITPLDGGGYRIIVDGPMSVLTNSGKYGFQMACFLPALLLCRGWQLEAEVRWGRSKERVRFELSEQDGLTSHFQDRGVYLTEAEEIFIDRFKKVKKNKWSLSRDQVILPLGGQSILVPDFRLRHDNDGREAYMEIIGFWRADYLKRRIGLLSREGPANLILAVSNRMRTDKEALKNLPLEVIFFKNVLTPKHIIEAAERVAKQSTIPL